MATLSKIYSDIDFTFTKKPVVGDVALSFDEQAVIRSVRNLLLTNHFERPFNPDLGSNINALLFELVSPLTANALKNEIITTIKNYEPRVDLINIEINPNYDNNEFNVTIKYYIVGVDVLPQQLSFALQPTR